MEYAFFLLKCSEYEGAKKYFGELLHEYQSGMDPGNKSKICLGFARSLDGLNDINGADKYYQKAIDNITKYDDNNVTLAAAP